jgi:starch synthase
MIQVLHISAECYPAAKTGGLGDVVGSLPKYLCADGVLSAAVIPKYDLKWIRNQEWVTVYQGSYWMDWRQRGFRVQQQAGNTLGYPLFVVDIPGLFDRPGIYNDPDGSPYGDEVERAVSFQQCVLEWLLSFPWHDRPRVLHCHDHHTALIPWMVKYCPNYQSLAPIPTVFTIHNGQYQGAFSWKNAHLLPPYESGARWILEWNGIVNPMAASIKSAWAVTTVSQSYLYELHESSLGLEPLMQQEWRKEFGIVNGIDAAVWDPATDPMVQHRLDESGIQAFKQKNKRALCEWFGFPEDQPIISFIGRIVGEKGADLLPDTYKRFIHSGGKASFLVLGTGEAWTQNEFKRMAYEYPGRFNAVIDYNEALAHQIYAGSDFLIMPSRVEPCGLNQLYAMRYGTIPIVRSIGGLKDTVPDIGSPNGTGRGIRFDHFSIEDAYNAVYRAVSMYHNDPSTVAWLRKQIMGVDFSWEHTVDSYLNVYRKIGAQVGPPPPQPEPEVKQTAKAEKPKVEETPKPKVEKPKVEKAKATPTETPVKTTSKSVKTAPKQKALKPVDDTVPVPPAKAKPKTKEAPKSKTKAAESAQKPAKAPTKPKK